jgi:hypothetical protein
MTLAYRMHTKADEPALIKLWSEHGGWDQVDAESWAHRLLETPVGPAQIVLATWAETGEIVGQFAFIPSLVAVGGREVPAVRPFAPIIARTGRDVALTANPLEHPVVAMHLFAVKALRERSFGLIYSLPDPHWLMFCRLFPKPERQIGTFPLWSKPLPLAAPLPLPAGYSVGPLTPRGEPVDRLWKAASKLQGCLVVRDSRGLPWKIGSGDYTVLGIEKGGELVGLVASRTKGDNQWLVCDLLTADGEDALRATLTAVTNLADARARAAAPDRPITKVAILATKFLEPMARELGFGRDDYEFPLLVQTLDPGIKREDVAPERWYLSAND